MSDTNDHSTAPNVSGGQGRAAVAACKGWNDLHEWHLYTYIASCLLRGIFPHPTPFHFNDFPPLSISFPYVQLFLTVHALSLSHTHLLARPITLSVFLAYENHLYLSLLYLRTHFSPESRSHTTLSFFLYVFLALSLFLFLAPTTLSLIRRTVSKAVNLIENQSFNVFSSSLTQPVIVCIMASMYRPLAACCFSHTTNKMNSPFYCI